MPDSLADPTSIRPLLDMSEAIQLGDAVLLPTYIKLDILKILSDTATRVFWKERVSNQPRPNMIKVAIGRPRSQSRNWIHGVRSLYVL